MKTLKNIIGFEPAKCVEPMSVVRAILRLDPDGIVMVGEHEKAAQMFRDAGHNVTVLPCGSAVPADVVMLV